MRPRHVSPKVVAMNEDATATVEEYDESDEATGDVKVSVGELTGDDLPDPGDTDLSGTGVALPEEG
jgi:hypothetical protein